MANYPGAAPALPDITDATPWDQHAEDHELEREEINAIGADIVAALDGEANLVDRLNAIIALTGGGLTLSGDPALALGAAAAGSTGEASDAGHVHPMPNAADVGADAGGAAAAAQAAAEATADAALGVHAGIVDGTAHGIAGLIAAALAAAQAYADAGDAALVDSSPAVLDTLNELAAALGDDPNFATTITNLIGTKQPSSAELDAIAALTGTAFGRSLLELVDAPAARTLLALGDLATGNTASDVPIVDTGGNFTATEVEGALAELAASSGGTDIRRGDTASAGDPATYPGELYATTDTLELLYSTGLAWEKVADVGKLPAFAAAILLGHSYTQIGANTYATRFANWTRRFLGALGVPPDETFPWGQSAGRAIVPHDYAPATFEGSGIGTVMRYIHPDHSYNTAGEDGDNADSRAFPALAIIEWLLNEAYLTDPAVAFGTFGYPVGELRPAFRDAHRTVLSRLRAARLYDSDNAVFGYSGPTSAALSYMTRGRYRPITADGQTATLTIPAAFSGGTLALCYLGGANAYAQLNGAATAGNAYFEIDDNARATRFPTTYPFDVTLDPDGVAETVTVTGRTLGTNLYRFAISGVLANTHANDVTVRRSTALKVTLSGTAGLTDVITLAGRGAWGYPLQVIHRVTLPASAAGQTIIATTSGYAAEPIPPGFGGAWIEDAIPPPALLVNQPVNISGPLGDSVVLPASIATLNDDLDTVAAEFTSVEVVDLETPFNARFGYTLGTTLNATDVTSTGVVITAIDAAANELAIGKVLRRGTENMLVTALAGTSPNFTASLLRGHEGTVKATHASGLPIFDRAWLSKADHTHPSDYGGLLIARYTIDTVYNLEQTSEQRVATGAYTLGTLPRMQRQATGGGPITYIPTGLRNTIASAALTRGRERAQPFLLPQSGIISRLWLYVTGSNLTTVRRYVAAIRLPGDGTPGQVLCQAPVDFPGGGAGGWFGTAVGALFQPVRRGWYWRSMTSVNDAGTFQTFRSITSAPFQHPLGVNALAGDPNPEPAGYRCDHGAITDAIPSLFGAYTLIEDTNGVPLIAIEFSTPNSD